MLEALTKLWPTLVLVALNIISTWLAWSMRQFAKNEVQRIVNEAVQALEAEDARSAASIREHGDRILIAEGQLTDIRKDIHELPTKQDLERVSGAVGAVDAKVTSAIGGITRIESFFLAKGVERV